MACVCGLAHMRYSLNSLKGGYIGIMEKKMEITI